MILASKMDVHVLLGWRHLVIVEELQKALLRFNKNIARR